MTFQKHFFTLVSFKPLLEPFFLPQPPRCATLPGTCNMLRRLYCAKGLKWNFFTFNNILRYWSYSVHGKSFRLNSVYEHLSCPINTSPGFRQRVSGGSGSQDWGEAWIFSGGGAGTTLVTLEGSVYHAVHQGRQNFLGKNIFVFCKLEGDQRIV